MGEFFHGWRRKCGLVTLVIACVFMAGWVRSRSVQDVFSIHSGRHTSESLSSVKSVFVWQRSQFSDAEYMTALPEWTTYPFHSETKWYDETGMVWRWQLCGFGFGELPSDLIEGVQEKFFFFPYWSVTVPLTLVSAWLLLSTARKSNQKKIDESREDLPQTKVAIIAPRDEHCSRTMRIPISMFSKEFKRRVCLEAQATLESFPAHAHHAER